MSFKRALQNGCKAAGVMMRIVRNPAACLLARNAGLEFIMYDCEHGSFDFETLHDTFILGDAIGLNCFVRVPNNTKEYVSRMLDCGAAGIMAPMIETVEQARKLVDYSKYPPLGKRGYTGGAAHVAYRGGTHRQLMDEQNSRILTIAQIESRKAIENIEEIAAVPGLDVLLIGPNDLSISLGVPGDLMATVELEAIETVIAACKKHGKIFGMHAGEVLIRHFEKDVTLAMSLVDVDLLQTGFQRVADMVRSCVETVQTDAESG